MKNLFFAFSLLFFSVSTFSQEIHCVNEQKIDIKTNPTCLGECILKMPMNSRWSELNSFFKNPQGQCFGDNCQKLKFSEVKVSSDGTEVNVFYSGQALADITLSATVCLISQNKKNIESKNEEKNHALNNNQVDYIVPLTVSEKVLFSQVNDTCNNLKMSWFNQARKYCLNFNGLDNRQSIPECASAPIRASDVFQVVVSGQAVCFPKNNPTQPDKLNEQKRTYSTNPTKSSVFK